MSKMKTCFYVALQMLITINIMSLCSEESFFTVPLEIMETNRPKRLVDTSDDPDMQQLKKVEDKIFSIVKNSSLGKEFKSFTQLVHLFDSEAGLEIGRLLMRGFMIGVGKENANELLLEFLDDFQYRVSPALGHALKNYKDFFSTMDFALIPLTIQTLFQKDELGNSLAHMPLGQLIDIVQPEASKYGVDIKAVINGILGKGDSTFPELVDKILRNFNMPTVMNAISNSLMEEGEESSSTNSLEKAPSVKKAKKDPTILLFKPFIAKFLKENEIDLDVDAVIQVMTPFLTGGGELLQNLFQGDGKRDFNLAQFAPILGLLAGSGGTNNPTGSKGTPDFLQAAVSMLGGSAAGGKPDLANILNIMSKLSKPLESKSKSGKESDSRGLDLNDILQLAQSFMPQKDASPDLNKLDPSKLLDVATNLLGSMNSFGGKSKNEKNLVEATGPFLFRLQRDKKCHQKIKDGLAFAKLTLAGKMMSAKDLKNTFKTLLKSQMETGSPYERLDIDAIMGVVSFSMDDWAELVNRLTDDDFREKVIENAVGPGAEMISLVATDDFQKKQNEAVREKVSEAFTAIGLNVRGISASNFIDRLTPLMEMASKAWDLPVSLTYLAKPLKITLSQTMDWYTDFIAYVRKLSREQIKQLVAKSLEDDFISSVLDINTISKQSQTSALCLPREVCETVNDIAVTYPESFKLVITRLASIVYGGIRSYKENDLVLFFQTTRAAATADKCEKYFPVQCPNTKDEQVEKSGYNMHEDL